ncbi:MAG: hypothetical protein ABIA21_01060 [Candidatus Aenigmatarchaeota archaeon]
MKNNVLAIGYNGVPGAVRPGSFREMCAQHDADKRETWNDKVDAVRSPENYGIVDERRPDSTCVYGETLGEMSLSIDVGGRDVSRVKNQKGYSRIALMLGLTIIGGVLYTFRKSIMDHLVMREANNLDVGDHLYSASENTSPLTVRRDIEYLSEQFELTTDLTQKKRLKKGIDALETYEECLRKADVMTDTNECRNGLENSAKTLK